MASGNAKGLGAGPGIMLASPSTMVETPESVSAEQ